VASHSDNADPRNRLSGPALALALAAAVGAGCAHAPKESPTSGHLEVTVCESHAALLKREAALFNDLYPAARVTVRRVSSREAFVALLADSVPFVVVDRPPNAEELAAINASGIAFEEARLAQDALGVFVNAANRLTAVTREQAADLLTGRLARWRQLPASGLNDPVRLVMTGRNSGAFELATRARFAGGVPAPAAIVTDESSVLARVAADPEAVGVASLTAWKEAERTLSRVGGDSSDAAARSAPLAQSCAAEAPWHALALIAPDSTGTAAPRSLHQANVYRGFYPWSFTLYAYFNPASRLAAGFSAFVCSAPGQKLILDAGLVPATMPVRLVQLR
jgi:phosphate transport system substrate-binding protein